MEDKKCLVELDEILNQLNKEELSKIPVDIRNAITEKKDKQYIWRYDKSKKLEDQNINRKTIAMLSYLNMEYLLNEEQKLVMKKLHRINEAKQEEEKRKKYNPENLFKKDSNKIDKSAQEDEFENKNKTTENYENKQMIITSKDKWYKKVIKQIFKIWYKKQ